MASAKRRPGRPLTPGNQSGRDGCPQLKIRLTPADLARIQAAGGSTWAREVLLAALSREAGYEPLE